VTPYESDFARRAFQELPLTMEGGSPYHTSFNELVARDILMRYAMKMNSYKRVQVQTPVRIVKNPVPIVSYVKENSATLCLLGRVG
jgi:hypothetical protein